MLLEIYFNMTDTIEYINWFNSPNWLANIALGTDKRRYDFLANWNVRDNSWYITIDFADQNIITGVPLRLNTNLIQYSSSKDRPTCILIPRCDDDNIDRITYNHMVNGIVKLYHILPENISE